MGSLTHFCDTKVNEDLNNSVVRRLPARATYMCSNSVLAWQTCEERLDRDRKWTGDKLQTKQPFCGTNITFLVCQCLWPVTMCSDKSHDPVVENFNAN